MSSAEIAGNGSAATTTRAPDCPATWRMTLSVALYSWSVVRISSPGSNDRKAIPGSNLQCLARDDGIGE
jgi:hypothetical protein